MAESLRAYRSLARAAVESKADARMMFVVRTLGDSILVIVEVLAPLFLISQVGSIGGWSGAEVALLVGLVRAGGNLASVINRGLDPSAFSETVRRGDFDQMLTRPISPLFGLLASDVQLRCLGGTVAGIVLVFLAGHHAGIEWTPLTVGLALLSILCCAAVVLASYVLGAATTFWTGEGSELVNIFNFGGLSMASYPLELYGTVMRFVFCWMVPIALTVYVPALVLLDHEGIGVLQQGILPLVPVVTVVFAGAVAMLWRAGVRRHLEAA